MKPRYSKELIHQLQQLAQKNSPEARRTLNKIGVPLWKSPAPDISQVEQLVRQLNRPGVWARDVLSQTDGYRIFTGLTKGGCYKQPMRTLSQDLHLNYLLKQSTTNSTTTPPPPQPQQAVPTPPKPPEPIKPSTPISRTGSSRRRARASGADKPPHPVRDNHYGMRASSATHLGF